MAAQRGAESVAVKKRAQITPSTNVKRVFAEGAQATYAIPEQGDNFGEMSTLSSLSGGGMSGGLGGSGTGAGFGKGAGMGGGVGIGGGVGKMFGLIPGNHAQALLQRGPTRPPQGKRRNSGLRGGCSQRRSAGSSPSKIRWLLAGQQVPP